MIDARFVPIATWPGKQTSFRRESAFRAKNSDTMDVLEKELKAIKAKDILIQTFMDRSQIRNDGWPKSNATRPFNPGVILTFVRNGKTISMPCDRYRDWECNLRAIALSLVALRAVDRYGVTQSGEQYRGWEALPASTTPNQSDYEMAVKLISDFSMISEEAIRRIPESREDAIKRAMIKAHPDKGGSHESFVRVRAAANLIRSAPTPSAKGGE